MTMFQGNASEATQNDSEAVPLPVSSKRKARANSYDCNTCNFAAHSKRKREVDASSDDTEWTMESVQLIIYFYGFSE
ncbi:unnamed protein product [Cylicostephanus goldi]|uniref:Uncharacterized protein n=1 Tax=Cylicostephanus goldi TaxID=71465 RepID=A0A3P7Q103_CYLGO|nr:unnamed protein product [Cylicostephanus goldi]